MKKIYSLTKLVLLSILLMGMSTNALGVEASYNFTATSGTIDENISFTTEQNSGSVPAINGDQLRLYSVRGTGDGNTLTIIPSNGAVITAVELIKASDNQAVSSVTCQVDGAAATEIKDTYSVSGINASTSVVIRNAHMGGTKNLQMRLTGIKVTYTIGSSTEPTIALQDEDGAKVTSIAFGEIEVNTTVISDAYTVTTANLTEELTLNISGANASYFELSDATLPIAGDDFLIEYKPTTTGSHTATLTISNTADGISETYEITGSATAPLPVITPTVNNSSLGIVDIQENVITVLLEDCVKYADPAYTITSGTATVVQEGDNFTVTATTDCTIQINLETISGSTVTLHPEGGSVAGDTELTQTDCSSSVILPEATSPCADWTFAGWAASAVTETTTAPTTLISAGKYTPTADVNLYAVFRKGDAVETSTTITYQTITGLSTSGYNSATWEQDGINFYADRALRNNLSGAYSLQLNNSKLYNTSPIEGLKSIALNYNRGTTTISVYEGTSANPLSDLAGTTAGNGTIDITSGNTYFTISVPSTATYLDGITLTYETGSFTYNSNPECTSIITDLNGTTADLGPIGEGTTTKTINVSGNNLTADITLAISGTDAAQFDVDPKTISLPSPSPIAPKAPAAAIGETPVTVTYTASASNAIHNAILTISSTGAPDVVISLTGETDTVLGMSEASKDGVIVTTEGNNIVVKSAEVATVTLYSVSGKLISTHKVVDGKLTIPATKGAYIVKVGDKIAKVVL